MNIPFIRGKTAKQAHVGIPEGTFEEEYARNGFFGKYAHLYRSEPPTNWTRIDGPCRPRAFDFRETRSQGSPSHRKPYLFNEDVRFYLETFTEEMPYYFRNADADEAYFIHSGSGQMETDFGPLTYQQGDYLIIPRGTVYRVNPSEPSKALVFESFSEFRLPDKGMLGEHALFDPAVIQVPTPGPKRQDAKEYELRIQRGDEITSVFYPNCPINAVGWKGTLCVLQINVKDIRPVVSDRYHLPPSAHTTWVANGFVICTFLPRPLENGDPLAVKVPFFHSNIDFDEVIFYHAGEFFSREGIKSGMLTFHPQGIHHGPQPQAIERSKAAQRTEEVAVMLDTKRPLKVGPAADSIELKDYWKSWTPRKT